jgi:hypothetical protein
LSFVLSFLSFLYGKKPSRYFFFLYPFHTFISVLHFSHILFVSLLFIRPTTTSFPCLLSFLPSFLLFTLQLFNASCQILRINISLVSAIKNHKISSFWVLRRTVYPKLPSGGTTSWTEVFRHWSRVTASFSNFLWKDKING